MSGNRLHPARRWPSILACLAALALSGCAGMPALPSLPGGPAVNGSWSGTIRISRVGDSTLTSGAGTCCTDTTRRTLNDVVTVEVVNDLATGSVSYNYAEHVKGKQAYDMGTFDITMDTVTVASGVDSQRSRVTVSLANDGSYKIEVDVPSVDGTWTQDGSSILTCNYPPPSCTPSSTQNRQTAASPSLSGASELLEGQMTPGGPAVLSGTKTEQSSFNGVLEGTLTISWNLVRK
jgi:hypothetical protein